LVQAELANAQIKEGYLLPVFILSQRKGDTILDHGVLTDVSLVEVRTSQRDAIREVKLYEHLGTTVSFGLEIAVGCPVDQVSDVAVLRGQ